MKRLKVHSNPISVEEQIKNLIDLGLIIDDLDYAKEVLEKISYYRLVKAYGSTFKSKGFYKDEIRFEDIVDLYKFNRELRYIILRVVEYIEISLRAQISNYFSLKYGNFGYEDLSNYYNEDEQRKVVSEIKRQIKINTKSPLIKNFKDGYEGGKVPLYAAIEVVSFGTLSKLYKNMKKEDKATISKYYGVKHSYFESYIENFAYIRNICAHYGRLYNELIPKSPQLLKKYRSQNISNNTLFATFLVFKIVVDEKIYEDFYNALVSLINKYQVVDLRRMGFPENWEDLLEV